MDDAAFAEITTTTSHHHNTPTSIWRTSARNETTAVQVDSLLRPNPSTCHRAGWAPGSNDGQLQPRSTLSRAWPSQQAKNQGGRSPERLGSIRRDARPGIPDDTFYPASNIWDLRLPHLHPNHRGGPPPSTKPGSNQETTQETPGATKKQPGGTLPVLTVP